MVQNIVVTACMGVLALTVAELLLPQDRFAEKIRELTACIFIIIIAAPVFNGGFEFELPRTDAEENAERGDTIMDELFSEYVCDELEMRILSELSAMDIGTEKISVKVNIGADKSIYIDEVYISCSEPDEAEVIARGIVGDDVPLRCEKTAESERSEQSFVYADQGIHQ